MSENIVIKGARVNNLKNVDIEIPRGKFVVVTGLSGSGKSSLAFDTLFAEGQRRFAESLSSYARQFLGRMTKPDVDLIEGIPPAIAIEQKVSTRNPRSTVATTTEIYDFLRLVFARIGRTYSPVSGREVHADTSSDVLQWILALPQEGTAYILADLKWQSREDRTELLLSLKEDGFNRLWISDRGPLRIDDALTDGVDAIPDAMLLVDRARLDAPDRDRLIASINSAFTAGGGDIAVLLEGCPNAGDDVTPAPFAGDGLSPDGAVRKGQCSPGGESATECSRGQCSPGGESGTERSRGHSSSATDSAAADSVYSADKALALTNCPGGTVHTVYVGGSAYLERRFCSRFELDGMTFVQPDEWLLSFNSPLGACPVCGGLGKVIGISEDLVVPDKTLSIYDGAIACWRGEKMGWFKDNLVRCAESAGIDIFKPYCELSQREKDLVWNSRSSRDPETMSIVGINEFFEWVETQRYKIQFKYMLSRFSGRATCQACHGSRLRPEAHYVKVGGHTITQLLAMNAERLLDFFRHLELTPQEAAITAEPRAEIISRLECILDVGLGYLTLDRSCNTLSGGESQRIYLVTALGSSLVGSMYILDEPSIGLHPRDTERLIAVLRRLRDLGNTVIVVEHDEEIIRAADMLVDMGPRAGINGGEIVFRGTAGEATEEDVRKSLTLQYLGGARHRYQREIRPWQYSITLEGVHEHNLKGGNVTFPLAVLTVVTGVSGSGKSSLVGDILYPALYRHINQSGDLPGIFKGLSGNLDRIGRVEYVDQNPIGRSTRSNALTYLKAYDDLRDLLSQQQYARINGFTPAYFSFNADGGRCPECQGEGVVKIEMQFMADVTMVCAECGGKRFKPDVLEVRYRSRNIDDILSMSVDEAIEFFREGSEPEAGRIAEKLLPLQEVGLGYIKLGQSSSTLSGGESQRIKLAYFLSQSRFGKKGERILFIFDEPTTGLHFYDVEKLLRSFDALLQAGHSLVVVEHNPDVIRSADWVIDLGPDAGDRGGEVVFEGTPSQLVSANTFTAKYL